MLLVQPKGVPQVAEGVEQGRQRMVVLGSMKPGDLLLSTRNQTGYSRLRDDPLRSFYLTPSDMINDQDIAVLITVKEHNGNSAMLVLIIGESPKVTWTTGNGWKPV